MDRYAFPALLLPLSYFLGIFSWRFGIPYHFGFCPPWYAAAFASCAAAWVIVPAAVSRARWRALEVLCLGLIGLAVLLVIRPAWLGEGMTHIPVLRSMRWPFREILQLQFFFISSSSSGHWEGRRLFSASPFSSALALFVCPLFFFRAVIQLDGRRPPSRFFRRCDALLDKVKSLLKPGEVIVPVISPSLGMMDRYRAPYSLIGAYNYPALFEVTAATGYTLTVPRDQAYLSTQSALNNGIYAPAQETDILRERPNARFLTLESVTPLRITLSSSNGPIDLTPFLAEP